MGKIVYRQMPALRDLPQQIPAPWAKARTQKSQGGGKLTGANPRGCARRMVMTKTDRCISLVCLGKLRMQRNH